ncbi:hypothetical protein ONE63_004973 [Megalurothrips usitatus]|uniref:Centriolar and ciliogenesis-associated protein HYLS1 C-terminal domain-containing protein n=1 Tax=Megalurothrips usitatus TaxID=439358 RepID=A0AAV7X5L9_9NEOP|nr:hypothetical protein ONE63_004973 [Megalurothrips usitatus]
MELATKIDPAEVLAHLNQLGYNDISPLQLKEFMQDLKKLIIYDQLSSSSGSSLTAFSSSCSHSENFSSSESSGFISKRNVLRSSENIAKSNKAQHPRKMSTSSMDSDASNSLRKDSSSITRKSTLKESISIEKGKSKGNNEENLQEAMKPKTSFIRPWQLQGASSGYGRVARSDPVSLYHYYQNLWAKRKCPGEDPHADLRWIIREKMLGQDPHLYSQNAPNAGRKGSKLRL